MSEGDIPEQVKATIASVSKRVWRAQFVLFVIRPIQYALTMAYFAVMLYAGTWIVVLALRHAGAIS